LKKKNCKNSSYRRTNPIQIALFEHAPAFFSQREKKRKEKDADEADVLAGARKRTEKGQWRSMSKISDNQPGGRFAYL